MQMPDLRTLFPGIGPPELRRSQREEAHSLAELERQGLAMSAATANFQAAVNALAFAPDGVLAVAREFQFNQTRTNTSRVSRVELYDAERQVFVSTFPGAWPIQFSPDGARIAMGSPDEVGVRIRDLASGKVWDDRQNDPPLRSGVYTLAFSPNGRLLATGGMTGDGNGELALLDAGTGHCLGLLTNGILQTPPRTLAFTPNGEFLISGGFFEPIYVWDLARRLVVKQLEGHSAILRGLAISPDGRTLASGDEAGVIKLWSLEQRVELLTLRAHEHGVKSLQFSPDGRVLASGGKEGLVRLWRAVGEEEMRN
jgi:WD40 repeat protein